MPVSYSHKQLSGVWTLDQVNAVAAANAWPRQGEYYLTAWGYNRYGTYGLGTADPNGSGSYTALKSPKVISTTTRWLTVAADQYSTVAIKSDGTMWSWGRNQYGQLGLNNQTNYSSPKQIGVLNTWSKVSSAYNHSLAIKTDGTLWAWGVNADGELGQGAASAYFSSPKQVGALTTWSSACAGAYSSFAIKTDGTLWSWGRNAYGQLGLNNLIYYSSPVQIGALTTWSKLPQRGTTSYFMYAIKTDGTLWAWGINASGHLGLGNTTSYSSPKQVGALTTWSSVQVIEAGGLALKTDGTLWSWGANNNGQLGIGNTTYYSSPKQIGALTTWARITGGAGGSVSAVKTDGTLWTWGYGPNGNLGLGDITSRSSPTQVGTDTDWYQPVNGGSSSFCLKYNNI